MHIFLSNYLRYRDSNQIIIYIDCKRDKRFFCSRVTSKYVYRQRKDVKDGIQSHHKLLGL